MVALTYAIDRIVSQIGALPDRGDILRDGSNPKRGSQVIFKPQPQIELKRELFTIYRSWFVRPARTGARAMGVEEKAEKIASTMAIKAREGRDPALEPVKPGMRNPVQLGNGITARDLLPLGDNSEDDRDPKDPTRHRSKRIQSEHLSAVKGIKKLKGQSGLPDHVAAQYESIEKGFGAGISHRFASSDQGKGGE